MMVKANVGTADRIVRIIAGVTLIALAATGTVGAWGYVGVLPLLTAFFRFCPAYLPFKFSTCAAKSGDEKPAA